MAIRIDQSLHDLGEMRGLQDWRLTQALAWWIASELLRRHPGELFVYPTGGGFQYDALAVSRRHHPVRGEKSTAIVWMNMNEGGHLTTGTWFDDSSSTERFNWPEVLMAPDRMSYVIWQLESEAQLQSPKTSPETTKASIAARVLAGFLQRSIWTPKSWVAHCGAGQSGMGEAWINQSIFDQMSEMSSVIPKSRRDGFIENDSFRYWFLCPTTPDQPFTGAGRPDGGAPVIGFDLLNGLCWNGSSEPIDLIYEYGKVGRKMDALIGKVCPPAY